MADVTTKVVQYEIRGDTVDLEQSLKRAIDNINMLQQKMNTVATMPYMRGGKDRSSFDRSATITKGMSSLGTLKEGLSSPNITAVTPDQLATIDMMNQELEKYIEKISKTSNANAIANTTFKKLRKTVDDMNFTLKKTSVVTKDATHSILQMCELRKTIHMTKLAARYINILYTAAADFVETMNLFNVAVGDAKEELSGFVEEMGKAFGLDTEPLYRAVAIFNQMATTLGDVSSATAQFSKNMTMLTYDLASLYNVDVNDMLSAVRSGLSGMTKPLMKYGISVHKATIEEIALRKGITKTYAEMNEAEKMYLRYIAIMEQTTNAQGDMAKTLESPANQLRVARDQVDMLVRNLGGFVMIIGKLVLPLLNGFAAGLNTVISSLNTAAGLEIPDYSKNLSADNQMLIEGTESAEDYADALDGVLSPIDEINQANVDDNKQWGTVDQSILDALGIYDNLMDRITSTTSKFKDIFTSVFSPQIFTAIGQVFGTIFDQIETVLGSVANVLTNISPAVTVLTTGLGQVLTIVTWLIDKAFIPLNLWLQGVTSNIWTMVGAFAALNIVQAAATGSWKSMIAVKAATWFSTTTRAILLNTVTLIKNAAAWVANTAKVIANTIANWWNNASLMAKIGLLTFGAGLLLVPIVLAAAGAFSSKADEVPKMAKGGVVTGTTPAIIGEGKYDEAVIPLGRSPQMQQLKRDIANEVSSRNTRTPRSVQRSSESNTPVILQIDGREFGRTSIRNISTVRRQVGVELA